MAGRVADEVVLSNEERAFLEAQVRRHKAARSLSDRCRMILLCAEGLQSKEVGARLGVHEHTVGKWRRRFVKDRIEGLTDEYRPGRPRTVSDDASGRGDRAHAEQHAEGCHPLVDPIDGRGDGPVAHHDPADLDRLRPAAASERDVQALHRSAVRRQGAGHRRPLHVAAEPGHRAVCGRKIADPGAGSRAAGAADGAGRGRAAEPTPISATARPRCLPRSTSPQGR